MPDMNMTGECEHTPVALKVFSALWSTDVGGRAYVYNVNVPSNVAMIRWTTAPNDKPPFEAKLRAFSPVQSAAVFFFNSTDAPGISGLERQVLEELRDYLSHFSQCARAKEAKLRGQP